MLLSLNNFQFGSSSSYKVYGLPLKKRVVRTNLCPQYTNLHIRFFSLEKKGRYAIINAKFYILYKYKSLN